MAEKINSYKRLEELIDRCSVVEVRGDKAKRIESITSDSRSVKKGSLFIAVEGILTDGHSYIGKAIEQGATAVLYDKPIIDEYFSRITYVRVEDSAVALAEIASEWYGDPSVELKLVGITGTNGKTTIAVLTYQLFRQLGYSVGLLSTIGNYIDEQYYPATHTTPDPISINGYLRKMVDSGCQYAFMEVSSHAIDQKRINDLRYVGGVFTNLTQDHLDYHTDMLEYLNVKKTFFDNLPVEAFALTNIDDKNGQVMLQNVKAKRYSYSLKGVADFKARIFEKHIDGSDIEINGKELSVQFVGMFNIYNLLAVYGTAVLLGVDKSELLRLISLLKPVTGRFQTIRSTKDFTIIIDYAHTPDAISNVLGAISGVLEKKGEIITVVGSGGNRDRTKRPLMAREALKGSDKLILTSDNPRFEEPEDILNDMLNGLSEEEKRSAMMVVDRREAIKIACSLAKPGDVVLIAGKGHEEYQEIKGVRYHFNDREEVERLIL